MKHLFISLIFAVSCASAQSPVKEEVSYTIKPGEVRIVEFPLPKPNAGLFCGEREIKYQLSSTKGTAIITASYFLAEKPFKCHIETGENKVHNMIFKVEHREYPSEVLKVSLKTIKLSEVDQERSDREQKMLDEIYAFSSQEFLFNRPFIPPLETHVTSYYGTRRVYSGVKKGQHLGIDYRAVVGDKVPVVNRGKVVFAGDLFYTGWTVIIDHGLDIFTVYGHLSKTLVTAGQMVDRGELIGLSGNTGRTSGPHLHWGVKIQGQYVDGFVLIDESKKYYRE